MALLTWFHFQWLYSREGSEMNKIWLNLQKQSQFQNKHKVKLWRTTRPKPYSLSQRNQSSINIGWCINLALIFHLSRSGIQSSTVDCFGVKAGPFGTDQPSFEYNGSGWHLPYSQKTKVQASYREHFLSTVYIQHLCHWRLKHLYTHYKRFSTFNTVTGRKH